MTSIFLNIAGFNLEIKLHKTEHMHYKTKMKILLIRNFRNFQVYPKPEKTDYEINFIDRYLHGGFTVKHKNKFFINFFDKQNGKRIRTFYSISLYQFQIILRKILLELLTKYNGFYLHASANVVGDAIYIFTGQSQAGKSTISRLLHSKFPSIADDGIYIRKINDSYYGYILHVIEKSVLITKSTKKFPVKKVFFLNKSKAFKVIPEYNTEFIKEKLVKQIVTDNQFMKKNMLSLFEFIGNFRDFYNIYFAKDKGATIKLIGDCL